MSRIDSLAIRSEDGSYHVPDPVVAERAERILTLFTELAPVYVGRRIRVNDRDLVYFYRAAGLCAEAGMDPRDYVRAVLDGMAKTGKCFPRAIGSVTMLRATRSGPAEIQDQALARYRAELALYEDREPLYGPEILADDSQPFSALFRACMAIRLGLDEIVAKYRSGAQAELRLSRVAPDLFGADALTALDDCSVHYSSRRHPAGPVPAIRDRS
jgi:hypothetical protein